MAMNTALSGIQAAQSDINATSNNIANAGTAGFRASRVLFADVFSSSAASVAEHATGSGTRILSIDQDFSQGSVIASGRPLDLAVEGQGFFAVAPFDAASGTQGATLYTRTGDFSLDAGGLLVNSAGRAVLGWPASAEGAALGQSAATAGPLTVPMVAGTAAATTAIALDVTLPAEADVMGEQAAVPPAAAFDPADAATWAFRTPVSVTAADGSAEEAQVYFIRQSVPDATSTDSTWSARLMVGGEVFTSTAADITFDAAGAPTTTTPLAFSSAGGRAITLDLGASAQQGAAFRVQSATADGSSPASMTALRVDGSGTIWATYGTGDPVAQGTLMLATFANPGGLRQTGDTSFLATPDSGEAAVGSAESLGFGKIRSGGLEGSNVDLTVELVDLITAQRNYQASAKALETSSSLMKTIMNLSN